MVTPSCFKVSNSLKVDYGLVAKNGSYRKYFFSQNTNQQRIVDYETKKGRYFEFLKKDFIENELETQAVANIHAERRKLFTRFALVVQILPDSYIFIYL